MEEDVLQENGGPTPSYVIVSIIRARIKDVYAGDVKKALLGDDSQTDALEELIAVGEAVFTFIPYSELDLPLRNAVGLLEKQFDFYRRLLDGRRNLPSA
jgi:hypothetical protein